MAAKKVKPPLETKVPPEADAPPEEVHEGHSLITIFFLIAVIVTIVLFIPPALVQLPQPPAQPSQLPPKVEPVKEAPDYESRFIRNSYDVNKQHNFGLFESKLLRMGFYTFYNDVSKQEETVFRADIWVRNVGKAEEDFNSFNGFIRQPPYHYNVTGGTFNGEDVTPGESREGYILFENIPKDLNGDISVSIGTARSYSSIFGIQSQFPFLYELSYPA
ncbi:TPA: hypothetical protein H1005_03975 [archaeon]|uniref:DUF4352 domain-containing protein n=1 Tax=Candidatus Naiadarchaeum limnaeum TaxID=2756139 RepID=A0A832V0Z3_9ARCH|nr:hypothetical protein [Candidatus Naiadarchaeales archaeon SRR2090153.bin1042]HIK00101.1 hypothetical protein [Candidatus Naiadarchaeum limnaeum]